ncbi:MAG: hypothetical protein KN64_00870 [Sulfurovum sp. AS07-7]|nr:MAG: hypothetical protein KN64_01270 [Sulfurovum sp. AS07-7]KIM06084.1 MAG: hypothetical protein KN64_00870 [Sulfurovum sp. AS07-7]
MKLEETLNKILENAEQTLDKMTGETLESRATAKEKIKNFFSKMLGDEKSEKDEKKNEKNS